MSWIENNEELLTRMNIPANRKEIERLAYKYPWFVSARIILNADNNKANKVLEQYTLTNPTPSTRLHKMAMAMVTEQAETPNLESVTNVHTSDDIIDKFLNAGDYKIVPSDDITDFDATGGSAVLEIEDGLVTEELAEIYMRQGMTEKAEEIYRILKQK